MSVSTAHFATPSLSYIRKAKAIGVHANVVSRYSARQTASSRLAARLKRVVNILGVPNVLAVLGERVSDLLFSAGWRWSGLLAMILSDVQRLFSEFSCNLPKRLEKRLWQAWHLN